MITSHFGIPYSRTSVLFKVSDTCSWCHKYLLFLVDTASNKGSSRKEGDTLLLLVDLCRVSSWKRYGQRNRESLDWLIIFHYSIFILIWGTKLYCQKFMASRRKTRRDLKLDMSEFVCYLCHLWEWCDTEQDFYLSFIICKRGYYNTTFPQGYWKDKMS